MEMQQVNPTSGTIQPEGTSPDLEAGDGGIVNVTNPEPQSTDWRARRAARKALQSEPEELYRYPKPKIYEPKITQSKLHACATRCWPIASMTLSGVTGLSAFAFEEPHIRYSLFGLGLGGATVSCCGTCAIGGEIYRDISRPTGQRNWIIKHQAKAIESMKQRLERIHKSRGHYDKLLVSYRKFVENGGLLWPYRVERFLSEVRSGMKSRERNWKLMKTSVTTEWADLSLQRKRLGLLKRQVYDLAQVACYNKTGFNAAVEAWEELQGKPDAENPFEMPEKSAGKWFAIYQMYDNEYRKVAEFCEIALQLKNKVAERCRLKKDDEGVSEIKESIKQMDELLEKLKGAAKEQVVEMPEVQEDISSEESEDEITVEPYEEPGFWRSVGQYVSFGLWG